jgi:hypothetical protein
LCMGVALRPKREGGLPRCLRPAVVVSAVVSPTGYVLGGWGACLRPVRVQVFGCVRGMLRVRVRCAVRRVRGVCGCACAGWVCLRPVFGIAGGCTGAGVCFHPGLDFRIYRLWGYCNFRDTFPDFIRA